VVLFWALVFLNPEFVMNEEVKPILAILWFNHSLHTLPVIGMALDFIAWRHKQPKTSNALKAIFAFSILYTINLHIVFYHSGFWVRRVSLVNFKYYRPIQYSGSCHWLRGAYLLPYVCSSCIVRLW
jgi:hypothetical protein